MSGQDPGTVEARVGPAHPVVMLLGRVALIVIALLTVLIPASKALSGLREPVDHSVKYRPVADGFYEQFTCIEREVEAATPRGVQVYVSTDLPWPADMWGQRLTEMTYPYAEIVSTPEEADVEIGLETVPGQGCSGIRVTVDTLG